MNRFISVKQLMFSVATFILGSTMLTSFLFTYTRNETWIAIALGALVGAAVVSVYGRLVKKHAGLTLIQINDAVFGRVAGKLVSALYTFFFFTLVVLNTRDLGSFVSGFILQRTPITVTYVVFLMLCAFAARKGPVALTRYSALLFIVYIAAIGLNTGLLINRMHPENLRPMLLLPLRNYLLAAHAAVMLPFCETVAFLVFMPYLRKHDGAGKAYRRGVVIAFCVILLIVVRDIFVLGGYTLYTTSPTYSSIRLIDIGDILTRLEIVFAVLLMTMLFFKVSVLLYSTAVSLSQLLQVKDYKILVTVLVVLCVVYADAMFASSYEHKQWMNSAAVYATFFVLFLPLVTLLVSELRGKARTKAEDQPLKMD